MADFVPEAPVVEGETLPVPSTDPTTTPTTENKKEWKDCANILQLFNAGYTYYVSAKRNANGTIFQYTLEITSGQPIKVTFTGKDANGNDIGRSYSLGSTGNKIYRGDGAELIYGKTDNGVDDKQIKFKPANMQDYIPLSLAKKSS